MFQIDVRNSTKGIQILNKFKKEVKNNVPKQKTNHTLPSKPSNKSNALKSIQSSGLKNILNNL
jgi:hypothetical protein